MGVKVDDGAFITSYAIFASKMVSTMFFLGMMKRKTISLKSKDFIEMLNTALI